MEAFERLMSLFMTPQCYEDIFFRLNIFNPVCLKMIISKGLGYAILAGSLMLRLPQILKILAAGSGEGISVTSEVLMMIAIFGSMSYGYFKEFPIAAYGDSYFLYLQAFIILLLVLYYQKQYLVMLVATVITGLVTFLLLSNMLAVQVIIGLNSLSLVLALVSKLNQAFLNYRNASTGNLSAITLLLQFFGCVARIFTSIQETGDTTLIINYTVTSVVNGLLVAQLFYYWNKTSIAKKKD